MVLIIDPIEKLQYAYLKGYLCKCLCSIGDHVFPKTTYNLICTNCSCDNFVRANNIQFIEAINKCKNGK